MFNVMVVDDVEVFRRIIKRKKFWGNESGFTIKEEASNGEEALLKLQENEIDLILTDIKMPVVDGIELIKKVREKYADMPIVIMSDYSDFDYAKEAIKNRAFDYLVKPVKDKDLKEVLKRLRKNMPIQSQVSHVSVNIDGIINDYDIQEIINQVGRGNRKVVEVVSRAIEIMHFSWNEDLVRTDIIVRNMIEKIYAELNRKYPWYKNFVEIDWAANYMMHNYSIDSIKAFISNILEGIILTLSNYTFCTLKMKRVDEICTIILENIENKISLDMISDSLSMNKSYLSTFFKRFTGKNIVAHMTYLKMERAKKLLLTEEKKVYEASYKLDYDDVEYFSRCFKKYTGISPGEYKRKKVL